MSGNSRGKEEEWEACGETVSRGAHDGGMVRRCPIGEVRADVTDGTGAGQRRGQRDEGA